MTGRSRDIPEALSRNDCGGHSGYPPSTEFGFPQRVRFSQRHSFLRILRLDLLAPPALANFLPTRSDPTGPPCTRPLNYIDMLYKVE